MSLPPSRRVVLIREISDRLATEDYSLIHVTLRQFSLPWSDEWQRDRNSYVLNMIDKAPDETLIDLARHVGFSFEAAAAPGIDPLFWRKGMLRLFVSHLVAHCGFACELQTALHNFGISGFVAHKDIEPTQEWQTQIETALASCDALIALLHPNFHASNWTDQEIGFAMGRGVPTFAMCFGQDPYGFIGRFQAFNGGSKPAIVLAHELFDAYRQNKQTQRRMSEVIVGLLEESSTFAEAKTRVGYLENLDSWDPSFSTRISSATKDNSQVRDSWGVPERVEALVQKWARLEFERGRRTGG